MEQGRLAKIDQELGRVRDHLVKVNPATAEKMGLYEKAEGLVAEQGQVVQTLTTIAPDLPCCDGRLHAE